MTQEKLLLLQDFSGPLPCFVQIQSMLCKHPNGTGSQSVPKQMVVESSHLFLFLENFREPEFLGMQFGTNEYMEV